MPTSWLRWLRRIAIALAGVVAALAFLWAVTVLWPRLSLLWDSRTVIAIEIVIAIAALALLAGIWWLWWRLPKRQVHGLDIQIHDPKDRADVEDNFRKTAGQALGGAAVLVGAVVAYLQFTQQQQASRDLLISNQVSKGFEQLAGNDIAMRLGGIYALEGVMNTSEQYHQPVLEALCAFVRDSTTRQQVTLTSLLAALFPAARDKTDGHTPATDIQAALTVIGRRNPGPGPVNLAKANIPGADLHGAHFEEANLFEAHLESASLEAADFKHANLFGAHLEGTDSTFADFTDAFLDKAHLEGANLSVSSGLTQAQIDRAYGDAETQLPGELVLPAHWAAPKPPDLP